MAGCLIPDLIVNLKFCAIVNQIVRFLCNNGTFIVYLQQNYGMNFEFDHQKSCSNKEKHGIDFLEAQYLWLDPARVIVPARTLNESRYLLIAQLHGISWSAVFTLRDDIVRIISVRKTRQNEKEIYQRRGI